MDRLRVIDIETTGQAPPAEIIEFGRVDVHRASDAWDIDRPLARLYRPLNGIPAETKAVHHLTEADFKPDTPVCTPERLRMAVWNGPPPDALVAHNCAFEQSFIPKSITADLPWICTYKVALRVWPDAPRHSNQVLRYWRDLTLDQSLAMPPHRAGPDAWVTANLLVDLLRSAPVEDMIAWTAQPKLMSSIPFGKHRGVPWSEVPADYLDWIASNSDIDADTVWWAKKELSRRHNDQARG